MNLRQTMHLLQKTTFFCGLALAIAVAGCTPAAPPATDAPDAKETAKETTVEADNTKADAPQIDSAQADADQADAQLTEQPDNSETVETVTATGNATTTENTVKAATNNSAQPSSIQVTDSGVGSITASTPFTVDAIQAAFPAMEVTTETQSAEGVEYTVIVASDGSGMAMKVEPTVDDKIYRVSAMSSQFSGASGHTVGESFSSIYGDAIPSDCFPGVEAIADAVSCPAPESQSVRYVFKGGWGPLQGQLPSDAELQGSTLDMMFWGSGNY